jgi:rhomboid protease GluP
MRLSARVWRRDGSFVLSVPADQAERAAAALATYDRENPPRPQRKRSAPPANLRASLAISAGLLVFFLLTGPRNPAVRWFERGSADAELILAGELWRAVTALTLHADAGHVLSNALACTLFVGFVCGALGAGVGSALILVAGAGGNLANAFFHGTQHVSVGASTAVFAAVGVLGSVGVVQRRRTGAVGRRAYLPIAGAFALLAMLGMSQHTDLWAHFFGFAVGCFAALPVALAVRKPPGAVVQWALGGGTLVVLVYCWALALGLDRRI